VGVTAASSISAGPGHGCARLTDGTVTCWGVNLFGQLGDGTTANHPTAAVVTGLAGVAAMAVGTGHSCAVKADGTLWCWGGNVTGQLGTVTRDVCTVQVDAATSNAVACALRPALVQ
jgi:alpha-tubulin suppressor-like RCC1 family protein